MSFSSPPATPRPVTSHGLNSSPRRIVAVGFIGTRLDLTTKQPRWRPTPGLCSQADFLIDELQLLHGHPAKEQAKQLADEIQHLSPQTRVVLHELNFSDPWDFEEVYAGLYDWCCQYPFEPEHIDYLFHMTTGTHVSQICGFLLTESRHFPGRLVQTAPCGDSLCGRSQIIDLDLSRYDQLANRFATEQHVGNAFLKGGIATQNSAFNAMIAQIEKVAIRSREPILLRGPTGAGKSQLAERIYQLKKQRAILTGAFVAVNCATLRGENAMAALFGHTKGAFTGAAAARNGFLRSANKGVLFLDEIGELGLDEQAMLLTALEKKRFFPVGSDTEVHSDFQLIAGTNQDLPQQVIAGRFRADLLARINLWDYALPGLKQRPEDIAPNLDFELEQYCLQHGERISFSKESRTAFLNFATSAAALWRGNFRDLKAAVTRMGTLAEASRIGITQVTEEIQRLTTSWGNTPCQLSHTHKSPENGLGQQLLGAPHWQQLDNFDQQQLEYVLQICHRHTSMAAAGRELFNQSRQQKSTHNDTSRLQKYLAKFNIQWAMLKAQ
ncbi:RNA repair transcriptional activator RtcR [Shewanella sp. NFH-SH190041]|uniref:RNA repair transcriptional activator RtcR n=1 Tax=Shewanella sp. NFH-SH190041 TaxID=2950245 RepID=UPI0021C31BC3|nr:RNA repair transcriptional activator RtcR [Shewanella sp. NFH-SH190041]